VGFSVRSIELPGRLAPRQGAQPGFLLTKLRFRFIKISMHQQGCTVITTVKGLAAST